MTTSFELSQFDIDKGFCARGEWCSFTHDEPSASSSPSIDLSFNSNRQVSPFKAPALFQTSPLASTSAPNRANLQDYSSRTLIVENVPPEALATPVIYAFFGTFGRITDVIVDPSRRKVSVTFNSSEAARLAISSPAAIFGNRFVKIYRKKKSVGVPENLTSFPSSPSSSLSPSAPSSESYISSPSAQLGAETRLKLLVPNDKGRLDRASKLLSNAQQQKKLLERLEGASALSTSERRSILAQLRVLSEEIERAQFQDIATVDARAKLLLLQNEVSYFLNSPHESPRF